MIPSQHGLYVHLVFRLEFVVVVGGNLGQGRKGLSKSGMSEKQKATPEERHSLEHVADDTVGLSGTSVVGRGAFTEDLEGTGEGREKANSRETEQLTGNLGYLVPDKDPAARYSQPSSA